MLSLCCYTSQLLQKQPGSKYMWHAGTNAYRCCCVSAPGVASWT